MGNKKTQRGKTVECIGMQGSGKTFTAAYLKETFDAANLLVDEKKWELVWKKHGMKFVLSYPGLTFWWLYTAMHESIVALRPTLFFHKMYIFFVAGARWSYIHHFYPHQFRVLDESFMQRILSLYERPLSRSELYDAIGKFPIADIVLYLESEYPFDGIGKVSEKRMRQGRDYILSWKKVFSHNLRLLTEILEEREVRVFRCRISGNLPVTQDGKPLNIELLR